MSELSRVERDAHLETSVGARSVTGTIPSDTYHSTICSTSILRTDLQMLEGERVASEQRRADQPLLSGAGNAGLRFLS